MRKKIKRGKIEKKNRAGWNSATESPNSSELVFGHFFEMLPGIKERSKTIREFLR
jgi:hypothetical protein